MAWLWLREASVMSNEAVPINAEAAYKLITGHLREYREEGGPDREDGDIELARKFKLEVDEIRDKWAEAKARRAFFICSGIQPKVGGLYPSAPYEIAKEFVNQRCRDLTLWFWGGEWWRWNKRFFGKLGDGEMKKEMWEFLDQSKKWSGGHLVPFEPKPGNVSDVIEGLKALLGMKFEPPMWLDTEEEAKDWLVFRNKVVNVLTGEVKELSPRLWVQNALDFDWDEKAKCPRWERFMGEVFPGDEESQEFVEEWLGYCMTEETKFQKAALFVGERRSGKGTICHVLEGLVGPEAYVGLSIHSWIRGENSAQRMLGKKVGVFADVRLKPPIQYGRDGFNPGGMDPASAEWLLSITGEDKQTIGRKFQKEWEGKLRLRITLSSNEVPNFNDSVLPTRFIKVQFGECFEGREELDLRRKLDGELSGIAQRCVRAYRRVCERGGFVQPKSADRLEMEVARANDPPFWVMARECFEPVAGETVEKAVAYFRFQHWCEENGRGELRRIQNNQFGAKLREVPGFEGLHNAPRPHGGTPRSWGGLRLRKDEEE
jgi:putative DNA primase/helicase